MADALGIALVGCGTVGAGVAKLLLSESARLEQRAGRPLELRHVVVQNRHKMRSVELPSSMITEDLNVALHDPHVDVICELMGGTTTSKRVVLAALAMGKHVVTANKALLEIGRASCRERVSLVV